MSTGADLHHHQAACGQLTAPRQKLVATECTVGQHTTSAVDAMDLDHALGQIDTDAHGWNWSNLAHGLPLSYGCRLMTRTTNLGALTPLPEGGKSLRIPIEPTHKKLRFLRSAHVQLQGLPHLSSDR